jgi:hypothetical protein
MTDRAIQRAIRELTEARERINRQMELLECAFAHIPDHDLERYRLGMVTDEAELARLEEHLLGRGGCAARARGECQLRGHDARRDSAGNWDKIP